LSETQVFGLENRAFIACHTGQIVHILVPFIVHFIVSDSFVVVHRAV